MEYSNNCNVSSEQNNNTIYVSGGSDTRLAIDVANNKSRYYAELAEGYKNEAKTFRDSAKAYAEQNSDVSKTYVDDLAADLRMLIGTKQDSGNYALASEIPTKVSDLQNDSNFLTTVPTATTTVLGVVKPDGETIVINDGIISAEFPTRNIGEIVVSTIPLTDSGLHLLDGALISGSGSYADFVTYIAGLYADSNYSAIFETESNWQSAVTTYGVCGKFVYNSVNNTVRLPKITGFVEGASGVSSLGDLTEAGLPNITGNTGINVGNYSSSVSTSGAFDKNGLAQTSLTGAGYGALSTIDFDASRSTSIYGNSNTVQPQSVKVLYYIVVATSTKTEIEVDIDEIATDLSGKADKDLANVSNTSGFRKLVEIYNNGTDWYKVYSEYNPSTGVYIGQWCEQGGFAPSSTGAYTASITLLKPYKDTNYTVVTGICMSAGTSYACTVVRYPSSTVATTGFNLYIPNNTYSCYWRTAGYIS